jgi:hypothetical protein
VGGVSGLENRECGGRGRARSKRNLEDPCLLGPSLVCFGDQVRKVSH